MPKMKMGSKRGNKPATTNSGYRYDPPASSDWEPPPNRKMKGKSYPKKMRKGSGY